MGPTFLTYQYKIYPIYLFSFHHFTEKLHSKLQLTQQTLVYGYSYVFFEHIREHAMCHVLGEHEAVCLEDSPAYVFIHQVLQ